MEPLYLIIEKHTGYKFITSQQIDNKKDFFYFDGIAISDDYQSQQINVKELTPICQVYHLLYKESYEIEDYISIKIPA